MREPVTKVDERFSDEGAVPTTWADTRAAIESAELFWVATVRTDGRPHVTPLVAVWVDDALYFSVGAEEQKAINLQHNQHVTLSTGCNQWDNGLDVMVEGVARRVESGDELTSAAEAWTHKWDGRWTYAIADDGFRHRPGGEEVIYVFAVTPERVLAFAKGSFSHTSHRF